MSSAKITKAIGYFVFTIIFIYLLGIGPSLLHHLQDLAFRGSINPYAYFVFMAFFPVLFGVLLAMPQFISKVRNKGAWQYDWIKFTFMGLPLLYVVITPIAQLPFNTLWLTSHIAHDISGVVFGFLSLSSFKKIHNV